MKVRCGSLMLASLNLGLIALVYLCGMLHLEDSRLGGVVIFLPFVSTPVLLLATIVYLPRELVRRDTRPLALIALALSIPCVLFLKWLELP